MRIVALSMIWTLGMASTMELVAQAPTITSAFPTLIAAGTSSREIEIGGTGFSPASIVRWNGQDLATRMTAGALVAVVPTALVATPGIAHLSVFEPGPSGGISSTLDFPVEPWTVGGGLIVSGSTIGSRFGWTLDHVGDTNQDGRGDFVVGALDATRVFSGLDGAVLMTRPEVGPVAGLGDVNGDGNGDFAIGSSGFTRIISGSTGTILQTLAGSVALDGHEDFDGDGVRDLVMGGANAVFIHSGATGALLWTRQGDRPQDDFGSTVAALHDFDGDSLPDVAIAARNAGPSDDGEVTIFSVSTGQVVRVRGGYRVTAAGDMDGDSKDEFIVEHIGQGSVHYSNGAVQWSFDDITGVTAIGDFNGDQLSDIAGGHGGSIEEVFVLPGPASLASAPFEYLPCPGRNDYGWALAGRGDVTGDGKPDLLVGAPQIYTFYPAPPGAGFVRVVSFPVARVENLAGSCVPLGSTSAGTLQSEAPALGQSFALFLHDSVPNAALIAGFSSPPPPSPISAGLGCDLLIDPATAVLVTGVTGNQGQWTYTVPIPNSATLLGVIAHVQVAVVGLPNPAGFAVTNALSLKLGY